MSAVSVRELISTPSDPSDDEPHRRVPPVRDDDQRLQAVRIEFLEEFEDGVLAWLGRGRSACPPRRNAVHQRPRWRSAAFAAGEFE